MKHSYLISMPGTATAKQVRAMKFQVLRRDRSLPHFGRKIYHFLMGMMCFLLYAFVVPREQALWLLGAIGGFFVIGDFCRLAFPSCNRVALALFGKIMRREELKSVSGNSFFILGLFILVFVFPKPIALLSILYLSLGDPVAAVVGTLYGKHRLIGKKSLEGAAANFALSGFATFLAGHFLFGLSSSQTLLLTLVGASASTISELLPIPVDDNFNIPVISALLLALASLFLPIF